jgi:hypothetical protein
MTPSPNGRPAPDPPAEAPDRVAAAGVTIAVILVVGTCSLREPGGPGLSPLAAGLALAGIALVLRYLGLGWLGCFGTLVVLAAAAQVMLAGAGARRAAPSQPPIPGRVSRTPARGRSGSSWPEAAQIRRPPAQHVAAAAPAPGRQTSRPGLQSAAKPVPEPGPRAGTLGASVAV